MNVKGEPESNFFRISHLVVEGQRWRNLSLSSKIVYMMLCKLRNRYADKGGCFWRSDMNLSDDCGISARSVSSAKAELKYNKLIDIKITTFSNRKSLKASIYKIID